MQLAKFLSEAGFNIYPVITAVGLVDKEGGVFGYLIRVTEADGGMFNVQTQKSTPRVFKKLSTVSGHLEAARVDKFEVIYAWGMESSVDDEGRLRMDKLEPSSFAGEA